MAPPEAMAAGRVNILLLIRKAVMMAMMGRPPEWAPLNRRITHRPEYKLPEPIGFECFMGKIAVVEAGDGEHTNQVKQDRHTDSCPGPADPESPQAHQVKK